jgi:hypothetical protein
MRERGPGEGQASPSQLEVLIPAVAARYAGVRFDLKQRGNPIPQE